MRLTIPSCLKMKIRNVREIGRVSVMSTNPIEALGTYSICRNSKLREGDRNWTSLAFFEDQDRLNGLQHFPFEAVFWAYDYPNQPKLCLHRREALLIIHACGFQTPQTWQAIALAAQTISTGEVKRILTQSAQYSAVMPVGIHPEASQYSAVMPVDINPEAPFYYQFGHQGSGSFSRPYYELCNQGGEVLLFVTQDEPSCFRWPVIIGIREH